MRPAAPPHEEHDAWGSGRSRDDDDDGERRGPMGGGWRASVAALTHPSSGRQLRLLVAFVLLHNFKPSEPFLVEWLTTPTDGGHVPGMSTRDVYARLFPVFTYSRVPSLIAIALASGAFGPKASVVLGAACALTTVVITASCRRSFFALAASQATVALSFASHHALLGLVFSTVDPEVHPVAAHATKAATMASCALSALCGQAMRSWMNAPLLACSSRRRSRSCVRSSSRRRSVPAPGFIPERLVLSNPDPSSPSSPRSTRPEPVPHADIGRGVETADVVRKTRRNKGVERVERRMRPRALVRRDQLADAGEEGTGRQRVVLRDAVRVRGVGRDGRRGPGVPRRSGRRRRR